MLTNERLLVHANANLLYCLFRACVQFCVQLWVCVCSISPVPHTLSPSADTLAVRRFFESGGSYIEAVFFMLYGFAPNPLIATIAYSAITGFDAMHTSGIWSNYMEVGPPSIRVSRDESSAVWSSARPSTCSVCPLDHSEHAHLSTTNETAM